MVLRDPADYMSVLKPDVIDPPDYATVISFTGSTSKYSEIILSMQPNFMGGGGGGSCTVVQISTVAQTSNLGGGVTAVEIWTAVTPPPCNILRVTR